VTGTNRLSFAVMLVSRAGEDNYPGGCWFGGGPRALRKDDVSWRAGCRAAQSRPWIDESGSVPGSSSKLLAAEVQKTIWLVSKPSLWITIWSSRFGTSSGGRYCEGRRSASLDHDGFPTLVVSESRQRSVALRYELGIAKHCDSASSALTFMHVW